MSQTILHRSSCHRIGRNNSDSESANPPPPARDFLPPSAPAFCSPGDAKASRLRQEAQQRRAEEGERKKQKKEKSGKVAQHVSIEEEQSLLLPCKQAAAMGDSSQQRTVNDSTLGISVEVEIDPGERRLNELGYKQELKREMTLFKCLAIAFSTMTLFTGIVPLYGSSFADAGPVGVVWGWVIVAFFTWFVGFAMAEICSSFPTTGSLYFWAAHLAGPKYGPLASWICAWLEAIGLIAGIGTQAYAGTQTLQNIILLCSGTNKNGGYFAPRGVFLAMYITLCLTWAVLNTFALNVIAILDIISIYWQVIGGTVIVILLPFVAPKTQSASYVFTHFEKTTSITGIHSSAYAVVLSFLVSQYSLYGYDAAAHLTEETKNAAINGPIAILASIGLISVFGWAFILVLTFSIQDPAYLFDPNNETGGQFVPAQILYDAFHGRYQNATGANVILCVIWASFFFGGLSITTSAARVVYALSRDGGIPASRFWRKVHPKYGVPANAVWLCATCAVLLGIPILGINVVFTAITSICTIGWVGGYAVPIFCRMVIPSDRFHPGPFHLGRFSRPVCLVAFLWICYTCSVFLLPTYYPIKADTFNYAPVALVAVLTAVMTWWVVDARHWFKGPVRNVDIADPSENTEVLPDQVHKSGDTHTDKGE